MSLPDMIRVSDVHLVHTNNGPTFLYKLRQWVMNLLKKSLSLSMSRKIYRVLFHMVLLRYGLFSKLICFTLISLI